ncbi:hypothetical protein ANO14919_021670 [Xylariales sp. No.14919]|nr:hypothetical protein ANO14919_021670 [Xylariales sp. No.14919]
MRFLAVIATVGALVNAAPTLRGPRGASTNSTVCITNNMGKMEAREDGYFGVSCNRMLSHGSHPVLYAFCNNGRYPEETTIDTGNFIDDDDGSLRCFNYHGE